MLIAVAFFTIGSIVAAVARDFTILLVGRSIQGSGGGGITALTEIIVTDLIPLRHRGKWFGYQGAVSAVGSVLGPVVGGAFAESVSWRWIFWINLPVCGLGFVAIVAFLKLQTVPGSFLSKVAGFDWIGVAMLTIFATSFLIAISWGDVMFPWSSWQTLLPFILGCLGLISLIVYEAKVPRDPLIRLSIFRQPTALVNYLGTVIHGILLWCLVYYLPLYYQCVKGYSATFSGIAVFPETFTVAPVSIVVGVLVSRWGRFRWAIWSGWTVSTFGIGLLCLLGPDTTIAQWVFLNLVPGMGLGMLYTSLGYSTITAAEEKDAAYAAAMYTFSRSFGQGIGVATGGAIIQAQLEIKLRAYPLLADQASALSKQASALVEIVKSMDINSPRRTMIIEAFADSLKIVWVVMAGLSFVGLVASLWTKDLDVNRAPETEQGLRKD